MASTRPEADRTRQGGHGRGHGLCLVDRVRSIPKPGQVASSDIKDQTRQCLTNLKARLEAAGSSLDKVVWANWSLRDPTEFDIFNEEWVRWFPGDAPVGREPCCRPQQRRAGFRISIGVIAEA